MQKSPTSRSAFFNPHALIALLFWAAAACLILNVPLLAFSQPSNVPHPAVAGLTFADRVAYQRAIEEVYWQHRIWPTENLKPKPSLDEVMSATQIEQKVEDYLRDSRALEAYWQKPIAQEQLQAEMDRMARDTKQAEVLRELFEALGNDPAVIAECLARPTLAARLTDDFSAQDQTRNVESSQNDALRTMSVATTLGQVVYTLPEIADAGDPPCLDDTWTPTTISNAPTARNYHTAVWTGSEMIVWGGFMEAPANALNTGGRYNPSTDSWTPTRLTNVPFARFDHKAVWTGSEMIVWGGVDGQYNPLNTGGRYNPSTDSWTPTRLTNVPSARRFHTAVWTGGEMIVWGGVDGLNNPLNTGGRYNLGTNSWTATSTTNAPVARVEHTAVWTGSEMIVWGGHGWNRVNTGSRYNPGTNSWTPTSTTNAPVARTEHTAVWTGTEMIVWDGNGENSFLNTGGRYNPSTNSWTATSTTNAPVARIGNTAVWTGSEMIVWGGYDWNSGIGIANFFNTGGRYNPSTDSWTATSTTNAPIARDVHTAIWTGSEMIVWGGSLYDDTNHNHCFNTGGRYGALLATNVASFAATLNGSVNPGGLATTIYFEWGTTTSYAHTTPMQTRTGNTSLPITANISGLTASTTYHFRIVATNVAGTRYGSDRTFTTLSATGAPVVMTKPSTLIASFSVTLNGSVDPHGLTTTVYFQYGTTTSYGLTTAIQSKTGNTYQHVAANISGLSASRLYHFRIVASNSAGTSFGSDRTFTTLSATGFPVVTTTPATNVAASTATLHGSVDPHGLTTTVYFQYGTTSSYGHTTPTQSQTGNTFRNINSNINGLSRHTTYHFRIVATNTTGTRYGTDRTFTTQ